MCVWLGIGRQLDTLRIEKPCICATCFLEKQWHPIWCVFVGFTWHCMVFQPFTLTHTHTHLPCHTNASGRAGSKISSGGRAAQFSARVCSGGKLWSLSKCMARNNLYLSKKRRITQPPCTAEASWQSFPKQSSSASVLWFLMFSSEERSPWIKWHHECLRKFYSNAPQCFYHTGSNLPQI